MKIKLITWIIGMLLIAGSAQALTYPSANVLYETFDDANSAFTAGTIHADYKYNTTNGFRAPQNTFTAAPAVHKAINLTKSNFSELSTTTLSLKSAFYLVDTGAGQYYGKMGLKATNTTSGAYIEIIPTPWGPSAMPKNYIGVYYSLSSGLTTTTQIFNATGCGMSANAWYISEMNFSYYNSTHKNLSVAVHNITNNNLLCYNSITFANTNWLTAFDVIEVSSRDGHGSGSPGYKFDEIELSFKDFITITGITPANGTNSTDQLTASFTFTSSNAAAGNCTLYINGIANATNNSIASGSSATLTATGMGFGNFNWSIGCLSATISETSTGNFTYYLDPNAPVCNFPASVMIGYMEDSYTFNVTCTDEHFYSMNITCNGENFTHFQDGLDVTAYYVTNTTPMSATTSCSYEYCDGHTLESISNVDFISKDPSKVEITKDAVLISTFSSPNSVLIKPVRKTDRISFEVSLNDFSNDYTFYYDAAADAKFMPSSQFTAWIVSYSSKSWFDMNNAKGIKPKVKRINSTRWEITLNTKEKSVLFESTGSLNCVLGSFSVSYEHEYSFQPGVCPSDTAGTILITGLVAFAFGLIVLGLLFRTRFFGVFGSIMLIGISWSISACAKIPGYAFGLFAIVALLWFAVKK